MDDFEKSIVTCKSCNGWGEIPGEEGKKCKFCNGEGVWAVDTSKSIKIGFPLFVDFKSRLILKIIKKSILTLLSLSIAVFFVVLIIIFYALIN